MSLARNKWLPKLSVTISSWQWHLCIFLLDAFSKPGAKLAHKSNPASKCFIALTSLPVWDRTKEIWRGNQLWQRSCHPLRRLVIVPLAELWIFVSPALAGKTHRDHLSPVVVVVCWCCLLLLSVVKRANIWLYLPHALMDFNQSWVIDVTWEPWFVDEVKGHISRSKVIWGQVVR